MGAEQGIQVIAHLAKEYAPQLTEAAFRTGLDFFRNRQENDMAFRAKLEQLGNDFRDAKDKREKSLEQHKHAIDELMAGIKATADLQNNEITLALVAALRDVIGKTPDYLNNRTQDMNE